MDTESCGAARARRLRSGLVLRCLPWLLAVALHLALIALWSGPNRLVPRSQAMPAAGVMQLQLLPAAPAAPIRSAGRVAPAPARSVRRQAAVAGATPPAGRAASVSDHPEPLPEAPPPQGGPVAAAGPDGPPAPSLLDTPATRQALRAVAAAKPLRALGDTAVEARRPPSPEERLGQDIARSARGDCLKGEFAGGGAGLLSLPFWLVAEMREKCRR